MNSSASKPVLLLLPGLMCDFECWKAQSECFSSRAKVIVPNYGSIDSIPEMAAYVLEVAPPGSFSLAGHSMGGRVALEVIRSDPARVDRLALLDTGYQALPAGVAGEKERDGRSRLLTIARDQGMRAMAIEWTRGMVHGDRIDTDLFTSVVDMISRGTPDIFAAQIRALLNRPDATSLLAQIDCPTLLLCGRQDFWSPVERHGTMQEGIAGSSLEIIEHSGHMTTMEQPAAVCIALERWLDQ